MSRPGRGLFALILSLTVPAAAAGTVNVNAASKSELKSVDGLTRAQVNAIVAHREEFGDFRSVNGLVNVGGIDAKTLSDIRDDVTVGRN